MVTFCDILHEAKQKIKNKLSRVRSTDWRSALRAGSHFDISISQHTQKQ